MLIVGQPGAGKSVAVRELAAYCVTSDHGPTPLVVRLSRLLEAGQDTRITLDSLAEAAALAVGEDRRQALCEALLEQIAAGEAIIFCDVLDECGTRAPAVAQHMHEILNALPTATGFVVSTRASGAGAAERLGLPTVSLMSPRDLKSTRDAVLEACANARASQAAGSDWLRSRRKWLEEAADEHPDLVSVPPLAVLLVLICADTPDVDLPKGRARLLHMAVQQSVERWEKNRGEDAPARPWARDLSAGMLLSGYIVLGRLLGADQPVPRAAAIESLTEHLRDLATWALAPAAATEVAEDILRFWDERVAVFVVNADKLLTSRSKVLAEIAVAMWTESCSDDDLATWVIDAVQYVEDEGALSLAVGLGPRVVDELIRVGRAGSVHAADTLGRFAVSGVVTLDEPRLGACLQLLAAAASAEGAEEPAPTRERRRPSKLPFDIKGRSEPGSWTLVRLTCRLQLPRSLRPQRDALIDVARHHYGLPERESLILTALAALSDAAADAESLDGSALSRVQEVIDLPVPPTGELVRLSRRRSTFVGGGTIRPGIGHVALGAVDYLDRLSDGSARQIFNISKRWVVRLASPGECSLARYAWADFQRSTTARTAGCPRQRSRRRPNRRAAGPQDSGYRAGRTAVFTRQLAHRRTDAPTHRARAA